MIIVICVRKRKQTNEKFRLLNHKALYISNTISIDVIRCGRNVKICRLIFYFVFPWACCPNSKQFARTSIDISDSGGLRLLTADETKKENRKKR